MLLQLAASSVTLMLAMASNPATGLSGASGAGLPRAAHSPGVHEVASTSPTELATAQPLPTWQTNGVVYAVEAVGDVVYVGGNFTSVRPPGAAAGTSEVPRKNLAAFDATTGRLLPFAHDFRSRNWSIPSSGVYDKTCSPGSQPSTYTCDTVYEIRGSLDKQTIYVGGDFETVDGAQRARLAAFEVAGDALTNFRVSIDQRVRALAVAGKRVFIAGSFTSVNGQPRARLAAVNRATAAVTSWTPTVDKGPLTMALTPDRTRVIVGGAFDRVNGVEIHGLASLDATSGETARWDSRPIPDLSPTNYSFVTDLDVDRDKVYISAEGLGAFDGRLAADPYTGQVLWRDDCLGATWAVEAVGGVLYSGSHSHNCSSTANGFPETNNGVIDPADRHFHRLLAQSTDGPTELLHWFPTTNGGIVGSLGPRDMTNAGSTIWVGGEFTTVNAEPQQGLTRFAPAPSGSSYRPLRPWAPTVHSVDAGTATVAWEATADYDDDVLTYRVLRDGQVIHDAQAVSKPFWIRPMLTFTETGLTPGRTYSYQVQAVDDSGTASTKSFASEVTIASTPDPYRSAVLTGLASLYWPFDETSGRFAGGPVADGGSGRYASAGVTQGAPGHPGSTTNNRAVKLDGLSGAVRGSTLQQAPPTFTAEVWFNTTTSRGGKIFGFGDSNTRLSRMTDRHVYMHNDGRLSFGVHRRSARTVSSPLAYNDGRWHHVVATLGPSGMRLHVDGARVATSALPTSGKGYAGYWQVGFDNLSGWPDSPTSSYFEGSVDEFAVYPYEMGLRRIRGHNRLGRS